MAFPQDVLDIKVEIAVNGVLTEITPYVYKQAVEITRGSDDESSSSAPSSCRFLLNNLDGRFSPRNPNGPYYGGFGRNTPILVSVMAANPFLDVPGAGYAQTVDSAQVSVTGDIDVRFDGTLRDWQAQEDNGQTELIGKFTITGNQRSWVLFLVDGDLMWEWSANGSTTTQVRSTVPVNSDPSSRLAVRVTHDVNNGAAGNTVTFYTAPTYEGPWEQLGDPVVTAGTTSIFDSTAPVRVGDGATDIAFTVPNGKIHAAQVYNGINGTTAANVIFANETVGQTSFTADDGLTWTVAGGASINNQYNRFRGEVTAWPSRWETGGKDVWVEMQAYSLLRRYGQGNKALRSTLARRIPSDTDLLAYWPMEDAEESTSAYSPIAGVQPMQYTGDVVPADHPGPSGSDNLPTFNEGSSWYASVPGPATSADAFQVEWMVNVQQAVATAHTIQRIQATGGTVTLWSFRVDSTGAQIDGRNKAGTVVTSENVVLTMANHINNWVRWQFRAVQNGGNVDWFINWIPVGGTSELADNSYAGTVGRVAAVAGLDSFPATLEGLSWGQLSVFNTDLTDIYNDADIGFAGESARDRFIRLCGEESAPYQLIGNPESTPAMGAQRPDKLLDLLQQCANTDRGILLDSRDDSGDSRFLFTEKASLYNQAPRMILDYTGSDGLVAPLDPSDDDLYLHNDVTASRISGSFAHVEQTTGPLSTQEPPNGVGTGYDHEVEVSLEKDDRLIDYAGWEVHLGTWDEERYPTVNTKLQAATHQIPDAVFLDVGCRIRITNPPAWLPPGDIDLMIRGYKETLSQFQWEFEFQCLPARPWDIDKISDNAQTSRSNKLDTAGSTLAEALTTTETDVDIITTTYPTWVDDLDETPFSVTVGGERMLVAAPGGLVNDNPFFASNVTGWSVTNGAVAQSTTVLHPSPDSTGTALVTPTGGSAVTLLGTNTGNGTANPVARYQVAAWVYSPAGWATGTRVQAIWKDSGGSTLSTSSGTTTAILAGKWTLLTETFTSPASTAQVQIAVNQTGTPASTDTWYCWAPRVTRLKSSAVYDEFGRTATDTWGSADSQQAWTNSGTAADYDVGSGFGTHTHPSAAVSHFSTITSPYTDSDLYATLTTAALSTGASQFAGPVLRWADASNFYQARVEFTTANVVTLSIREMVAGVEAQLGTYTLEHTHVATTNVRVRFQSIGTTLRAKIWVASWVEPDPWQISVTDSSLTAAGSVGLRSMRNTGNTNANAVFRFDDFELANPQTFTVVRSMDGIVKAHSAGDDVSLTYPMVLAL